MRDWMREKQLAFKQFEEDTRRAFRESGERHFNSPGYTLLSNRSPPSVNFLAQENSGQVPISSRQQTSFLSPINSNRIMLSTHQHIPDSELSPKAKVSYDESKFQIELNVHGFKPEDLSIKTEGDVLIIHARHESKPESGGNFKSNEFEQRFSLPSGVKPELITSKLSESGFLVVTAPREAPSTTTHHHQLLNSGSPLSNFSRPNQLHQKQQQHMDVFSSPTLSHNTNTTTNNNNNDEGLPQPKINYEDDKVTISLDCHKYRPEELDVKVEGSNIIVLAKQEIKEAGGTRKRVFEQSFSLPSGVKPENISSNLTKEGYLIISAPRGNTSASISSQNIERRLDSALSPSNWGTTSSSTNSPVVISSASSPIAPPSSEDDAKVVIENDTYKILLDVSAYKPEELVIKTLDNSVHIKAKHEEKTSDGRSSSVRQFSKSYTLPKGVNPESVVSSLSKEGVLTVSAPLPTSHKLHDAERLVPIKHT
eukprot:TRINITY_DN611_c0_g1_i2.p1 TRINITY_DN611_c0_g1~~TRINITY_DN611_c0_g1_i2.p1  ORF type:complete len:481 (-),score=170.90 TRINITY_DN611_c0_g1_i2:1016-2458(-)